MTGPGLGDGARTTSTGWAVLPVWSPRASLPIIRLSGARSLGSKAHQNEDGGWGEDLRSYREPSYRGRGPSTASQTGWALMALIAADERSEATERAVQYLVETQNDAGSWDEPWFTGTGFPGDFYINYHLYRLVFPLMALGRYVRRGDPNG